MKFKKCLLFVLILGTASLAGRTQDQPAGPSSRGVKPPGVKPVEKFVETRRPATTTNSTSARANPRRRQVAPIGLGLTIYRQNPQGEWISAAPTQVFRTGDRVRFMVETNRDGYLYLFNVTDRSAPVMIFPAGNLHQGANAVKAHVPYEIPNQESVPPWFEFKAPAAVEQVHILFARRPLTGVLRDQALVAYCQEKRRQNEECIWEPSRSEWAQIAANAEAEWADKSDSSIGQAQSAPVREALSRSLRHPSNAPAPALVKMRASSKATKVIMSLELTHK